MKRILASACLFSLAVLVTYFLLTQPGSDQKREVTASMETLDSESPSPSIGSNGIAVPESEPPSSAVLDASSGNGQSGSDQEANREIDTIGMEYNAIDGSISVLDGIELAGNLEMFHGLLEQEARDESWAAPMETELYDYFFSRSQELASNFGVPYVHCRQTICEVQVIGYGQDSVDVWETATSDMDSQPWAEDIVEIHLGGNRIEPDATGLVLIIRKELVESTIQSIGETSATI